MVKAPNSRASGRAEPYRKGHAEIPSGTWKHDLHDAVKQSLASRLSSTSSSRPVAARSAGSDLASRLSSGPSAKGRELLPSGSAPKLHGFEPKAPTSGPNAGRELLPTRNKRTSGSVLDSRVVASGLGAAGLGGSRQEQQRYQQVQQPPAAPRSQPASVSIFGAAKTTVVVRVENLAPGTTADDVVSAFSSSPIVSAAEAPSQNSLVAIDLEFASKAPADELIAQYNGVVADGNTLRLGIVRASLSERMNARGAGSGSSSGPSQRQQTSASSSRQELLPTPGTGKMYSDTILASNPSASVITVASSTSSDSNRQRADAWSRNAPAVKDARAGGLAGRIGKARGTGQRGGGSYADMMVD